VTETDIEARGVWHVGEKAEILAEVKKAGKFFYGTVVEQAERIDLVDDTLVFAFAEPQFASRIAGQLRQKRKWLEGVASRAAGRKIRVEIAAPGADDARATVMMQDGFIVDREVLQWIWDIESRGGYFVITETESGEMKGAVCAETGILTPVDKAFLLAHISEVERIMTHEGLGLSVS
jgi:hypothetical protein